MEKTKITLIVVAITTLFICALYVLWAQKTPNATKKNKAFWLLIGVLLEIFIGIGVGKVIEIITTPPTTHALTITASSNTQILTTEDSNKAVDTSTNSQNNNDNEAHSISQSHSITTESIIEAEEITTITNTSVQSEKEYTVFLSFEAIPLSFTDNNGDFRAFTSFKAEKVTLYCEVNGVPYGEFDMKTSDLQNWTYDACFYDENTYVITAVAEGPSGEARSNTITVKYPF